MVTTTEANLAAWLLEQIAEDERLAHDGEGACAHVDLCHDSGSGFHEAFGFENGPGRWLAECDAKRRIIALEICTACAVEHQPCDHRRETLRLLALPYADRPGYREEWRP